MKNKIVKMVCNPWLMLVTLFLLISTVHGVRKVSLEQHIEKLIKTVPGQMGVAALHLESGRRIGVNGDVRFPMASTYKLPIALCCLSMVDKGYLSLSDKKIFSVDDLRRFSNISTGQWLSIKKIIQLMLEKSDNAASDMILKTVGGGGVVTAWLHEHGISDMRVDRSTLKMCGDISSIVLDDDYHCSIQKCTKLMKKVSSDDIIIAQKKFFDDQRDTTTPYAMVDLLSRLYGKKLVSVKATNFLLNCMSHCEIFGKGRITRLLPKKCKVWHKTGRIDRMDSDIGIFELPHNKGHVILAIYSNRDTQNESKRERAMAKITRALYDYFAV